MHQLSIGTPSPAPVAHMHITTSSPPVRHVLVKPLWPQPGQIAQMMAMPTVMEMAMEMAMEMMTGLDLRFNMFPCLPLYRLATHLAPFGANPGQNPI